MGVIKRQAQTGSEMRIPPYWARAVHTGKDGKKKQPVLSRLGLAYLNHPESPGPAETKPEFLRKYQMKPHLTIFICLLSIFLCGCMSMAQKGAIDLAHKNYQKGDYEDVLNPTTQLKLV